MTMNLEAVNPQTLATLLKVLRDADVLGFELTGPDGGRIILQLAPRTPSDVTGAPLVEVYEPGGWKAGR